MNEETIRRYKTDLAEEIEPAITELIQRGEQGLSALLKQEAALKVKVETISYLTEFAPYLESQIEAGRSRPPRSATGTTAAQKLEARRIQTLTKQREKLEEEARVLEEEVKALVRHLFLFPS